MFILESASGIDFVLSFAIGASLVTAVLWLIRFMFHTRNSSFSLAYANMPSFHFRVMWLPGGISGLLWSVGNAASMISVDYLGEAIGYSVIQGSILISGLWGIFWFNEVKGSKNILFWFLSAFLTFAGILLLTYEHK